MGILRPIYITNYMGFVLSGFLHWIDWSRVVIFAFDLESEDFQGFPLPLVGIWKEGLDLDWTVGS